MQTVLRKSNDTCIEDTRDMSDDASYLTITVDKSHLIAIGERLYEQSIELIRELVNNAYDACATRIDVMRRSNNSSSATPG